MIDSTWFYCTGCRIEVHWREVEHESHSQIPYHRKCGADVEVRKS